MQPELKPEEPSVTGKATQDSIIEALTVVEEPEITTGKLVKRHKASIEGACSLVGCLVPVCLLVLLRLLCVSALCCMVCVLVCM